MSAKKTGEAVGSKKRSDSSAANGSVTNSDAGTIAGLEELNKVRSILFGDAYRELRDDYSDLRSEIEKRFAALEKSLSDKLDTQIEKVRSEASDNVASLTESINSEGRTQAANLEALEDRMQAADTALNDSLSRLGERLELNADAHGAALAKAVEELRSERQSAHEALSNKMTAVVGELTEKVDDAVSDLKHAKTDRRQLAELFEGIAASLRSDS